MIFGRAANHLRLNKVQKLKVLSQGRILRLVVVLSIHHRSKGTAMKLITREANHLRISLSQTTIIMHCNCTIIRLQGLLGGMCAFGYGITSTSESGGDMGNT